MPKPMNKLRPLTRREAGMNFDAFGIKKPPFYGKGTQLKKSNKAQKNFKPAK